MAGGHGGPGMIKTILITVFIVFILGVIVFWIVTGGPARAWHAGTSFTNPIAVLFGNGTTTGVLIRLPWQPETTRGPDISDYVGVADSQLSETEREDGTDTSYLQEFGSPSPYAGHVTIAANDATARDSAREHVVLRASASNNTSVLISGWTLQSPVSGIGAVIPEAAPIFIGGVINAVEPVSLAPGASAYITTGISPLGVSFRETRCSGYLNQVQQFYPALPQSCPASSETLPQNAQNLRTYGASCFDYIEELQRCYYPGTDIPSSLSGACRTYVSTALSYNGCTELHRSGDGFARPTWRLYLSRLELWSNPHDVIRLLDGQGRVVDVLSY